MSAPHAPVVIYVNGGFASPEHGPEARPASSGEVSGPASPAQPSSQSQGRPVDLNAYRRLFKDRWAGFLRRHFRNSLDVAVHFSVDEKTARLWLEGVNGPQGWVVAHAMASIPGAAQDLMEAA
jgi:hypothetical protein